MPQTEEETIRVEEIKSMQIKMMMPQTEEETVTSVELADQVSIAATQYRTEKVLTGLALYNQQANNRTLHHMYYE